MTTNKLEIIIDKLVEKIRNLPFEFKDSSIESEATELKESAIASLEDFLELAEQDCEQNATEEDDLDSE